VNTATDPDKIRTQAEAFASALELGAVVVDRVVEWADAIIEREDHPHWSICELATCGREYPPDVANRLRKVPGVPDIAASKVLVLQMLRDSLTRDPRCASQIAHCLFDLATADEIADPELKGLAWWAWDALDLADAGMIQETRADVVDRMLSALSSVASDGVGPWLTLRCS